MVLILYHAAEFAEVALFFRVMEAEAHQCELLQFEEIKDKDGSSSIDACEDKSVSSDASFGTHLNSGSGRVFRMPCLPCLCPIRSW